MDMELFTRAARAAAGVAGNVKPDQFDLATPCPDWDVRALANHFTHWSAVVSERTALRLPRPDTEQEDTDYTQGDWPAFFTEHVERAVAAWSRPGAWEGEAVMTAEPRPAEFLGTMLFAELVTHGWDLAVSTGQSYVVPDAVAEAAYQAVAGMAEMGRQWGAFGPEVPVPADAPVLDRALGLSGRDPGWRR
jgi:uncharacterized protein (TIGR03086 family)